MKTLSTLLLSLLIIHSSTAQKRSVNVNGFSELSLGIPATLYLRQGSDESVEIECDDDLFDEIEFELRGDRLRIKRERDWNWGSGWRKSDVDIYVTMKEINELSVSGSGLMESKGEIKTDDLELSVSGSGDMELELDGDELEMRISGSGSISLEGNAKEADARISGSGKVRAEDLSVEFFEASISGSGSCYITVSEEVKANISGSGSVYYNGDPKRINGNSSGSGKIRRMR